MNGHERPWCSLGGTEVLEKNMLISVEPGIYIDEIGGFRHSDTVLVTENGYEVLTKYPTDIDSLIVKENRIMKKFVGKIIKKKYNC
ncbi:MAG: M24 family metallopeptidase [Bacillota bacterium]|nr:M24 family metallopeptidase [Bacillota bacterium]